MKSRNQLIRALMVGVLLSCGVAFAQESPAKPAFEVATIKPSPPLDMAKLAAEIQAGKMPAMGPRIDGALATYTYVTPQQLITIAYKVKPFQIAGPAWLSKEHFDIAAKIPDGASKDDVPKMLQALLADRFKLVEHQDDKEGPVLALVVGKDGPKLKESPPDEAPVDVNAPLKPGETRLSGPSGPMDMTAKRNADGTMTMHMNMGKQGSATIRMDMQAQTMTIESSKMTMAALADALTQLLRTGGGNGRQVLDMTGLKGNYQVALTLSMASLMAMARAQGAMPPGASAGAQNWGSSPGAAASEPGGGGATVYESVKKLGLALEPRTAKVEELVVDHIEQTPTPN